MSQVSSYAAGNGVGAIVRAAFNAILDAVKSNNSHATTAPSGAVAGMTYEKLLSATCQELWKYDGTQWVLTQIVDPTAHKPYPANDRSIRGLTLSNNVSDATNDIDIAAGNTAADSDGCPLVLTSALTKRLDAAWAVGANQGGLDTGSIGNNTYHLWLIRRPDTGVVDVLFSLSASSPTMPANYTQKRRIGSIIRSGGAIVAFRQVGDLFKRTPATDRSNTAAAASALLSLSVPAGIVVRPLLTVALGCLASVTCSIALGDAATGSADTTVLQVFTGAGDTSDASQLVVMDGFISNTSGQIYFAQINTAGTPASSQLITVGWIDRRGQDAA